MGNFHKRKPFCGGLSPKSPIFHQIHLSTDQPKSKPKFSPFQRLFIVPLPKIGPPSQPRPDREGITAEH